MRAETGTMYVDVGGCGEPMAVISTGERVAVENLVLLGDGREHILTCEENRSNLRTRSCIKMQALAERGSSLPLRVEIEQLPPPSEEWKHNLQQPTLSVRSSPAKSGE